MKRESNLETAIALAPRYRARTTLDRLAASWPARVGGVLVLAMFLVAISPRIVTRYDANHSSGRSIEGPSAEHWLGTDKLGKDVLARTCYGARLSLLCGTLSVALAIGLGMPAGALAGYFGGFTDTFLMRSIDIALAFPSVLIALLVASAFRPGWETVVIAVGLINVPTVARQVRATVISVRSLDYVLASRALGSSAWRTLAKHIVPSLAVPVITLATLGIGTAILEVAALSFLGIGGDPTEPEWGSMLGQAKNYWNSNPCTALGPGLAISMTVLGFNLLGDALQDALDPKRFER